MTRKVIHFYYIGDWWHIQRIQPRSQSGTLRDTARKWKRKWSVRIKTKTWAKFALSQSYRQRQGAHQNCNRRFFKSLAETVQLISINLQWKHVWRGGAVTDLWLIKEAIFLFLWSIKRRAVLRLIKGQIIGLYTRVYIGPQKLTKFTKYWGRTFLAELSRGPSHKIWDTVKWLHETNFCLVSLG